MTLKFVNKLLSVIWVVIVKYNHGSSNFEKLYKLRLAIEKLGQCFQNPNNLTHGLTIDEPIM